MYKLKTARAGFTLIELLVVVIIIGILASVALPMMSNAQDRARNSSVISSTRSVFLGMEAWKADHPGRLPIDLIKPNSALPPGWPASNQTGSDPDDYLAADTSANAGAFTAKYVPGALLPRSPWSKDSQSAMDSRFNNAAGGPRASIGADIINGRPLSMATGGFFEDSGGINTGSPSGDQPLISRDHYGYMYYIGDIASGNYALFGVGKLKKNARVFAVKTNF